MLIFNALVIFVYGLIVGSFLNALLWRVKVGRKISQGRSVCPKCQHELAAVDLIPVLSWLWLRGKCRYCGEPISISYPIVELVTGLSFVLSYLIIRPVTPGNWIDFLFWLYILASLIFLAVYDLRWMILPDKVLLPAIVVALVWRLVDLAWLNQSSADLINYLLAALASGAGFYGLAAVSGGKWMGGGDIKLVLLMGLVLGPSKMVLALLLAFNVAALVGVALIALKLKSRRDMIPFGPFLAGVTIVAYLYGNQMIELYVNLGSPA